VPLVHNKEAGQCWQLSRTLLFCLQSKQVCKHACVSMCVSAGCLKRLYGVSRHCKILCLPYFLLRKSAVGVAALSADITHRSSFNPDCLLMPGLSCIDARFSHALIRRDKSDMHVQILAQ